MYSTSQKYKDNIYADTRTTTGRITFDISDTTAAGDVSSITTSPESPISVKTQLINKVRSSTYKTATLEQDRFALDGSFSFADDTLANNGELGWSSAVIGSANGEFFENLLGTDGNCASLSPWTIGGVGSIAVEPTLYKQGGTSFKLVQTSSTFVYKNAVPVTSGKYYIALMDVYITSAVAMVLNTQQTGLGAGIQGGRKLCDTSLMNQWQTISTKFLGSSATGGTFSLICGAGAGTITGYMDGIRLYEVSSAEYSAFDTMTATQLGDKYPYQEYRPAITFNFTSNHSSAGLTIAFDQLTGEYATDFDMTAYDASNAIIATTSVTGNTDVIATPLGQLYNYRKVSVVIKKWSVPNRRARVMEVDFGIVKQYTDDNLISMNLIEEMDLLTGKVPSAEFKFTVDNSAREFNILNPTGFYKYLQQKQQVIGEIGLDIGGGIIEYIPIGNYLLQEWQSDEGSLTATFTARTNLDNMSSFDYENLSATSKTLFQFAVDIFAVCGITNYSIDTALQSITTNALVKKANCKDILQMIAIAGCANIYVTRDNIITLKCNPSTIVTAVDTATFDNMYQEPQIALDKPVKRVEVTYWTDLSTSAIVGVESTTDTLGDTLKLENNTLINTSARATAVANWMFAQLKYRATYKLNWRGNQALELNDVIDIENTYGGEMSAYITRNELDYAGYLQGRIEAKGVVN